MGRSELISLAGFTRKHYYTKADGFDLLTKHQEIAGEHGVHDPYYRFTDRNLPMRINEKLSDDTRVRVGEIGAYPAWQVAVWIHEQVARYVQAGTMGRKFDDRDEKKCRALTAAMMAGYDESRLIVTFDKEQSNEGWTPIAGVQSYRGRGEGTLWEAVVGDKAVSVGSLTALKIDPQFESVGLSNLRDRYGGVGVQNVIEMSRLWRAESQKLVDVGVETTELSWMAMAFLILGIAQPVLRAEVEAPALLMYDTSEKIQGELARIFDMRMIVDAAHLTPTEAVLATILKHHYGYDDDGGYAGELVLGEVAFAKYLLNAWIYLVRRGVNIIKLMEVGNG